MAELKRFTDIDSKADCFRNKDHVRIDTVEKFEEWFNANTTPATGTIRTNYIYRGSEDASYKLYTSAQRLWIQNDLKDWNIPESYGGFISDLVAKGIENEKRTREVGKFYEHKTLFQKVIETYGYRGLLSELIMLSIIQHYSGPTPFMDWTYNLNVALFFATENVTTKVEDKEINNYFSVYSIDKSVYQVTSGFPSIRDVYPQLNNPSADQNPTLSLKGLFTKYGDKALAANQNKLFYISDFDYGNVKGVVNSPDIRLVTDVPLTTVYNQNIVPQEGLFIFNPYCAKPIDEIFCKDDKNTDGLPKFRCFNFRKDLADYIRRRIREKFGVDKSFIYPHLYTDIEVIKNKVLNAYAYKG